MKVLYASEAVFPSEVTHSLSMMRMCQAFADCGHEVTLAGVRRTTEPPSDGGCFEYYGLRGGFHVTTFPVSHKRFFSLAYARDLERLCHAIKPDLIYSRLCLTPLSRLPRSVPLIYEMHSPGPVGHSFLQRKSFEKNILKRRRPLIVVTTNMLRDYLLERYPGLDVMVARLSAELPIDIRPAELEAFAAENLRGQAVFKVGYTGYLDDFGLRGTEIICHVAEEMRDVDFHVVGGTPQMVEVWSNRARSRNLYFYGRQNPPVIPFYLRCFDVVLAPLQLQKIRSAPFGRNMSPLKLSQYFAYRCAIVASDIPAHRELIEHEQNGLLVDAKRIDRWVAAIRRLEADPRLGQRLREGAGDSYGRGLSPGKRVAAILGGLSAIRP